MAVPPSRDFYGFAAPFEYGAHLNRLLKMCREIFLMGEVRVWRGGIDDTEIRAIRNGEWPYDKLVGWA